MDASERDQKLGEILAGIDIGSRVMVIMRAVDNVSGELVGFDDYSITLQVNGEEQIIGRSRVDNVALFTETPGPL